jgi:hypothetical protein
MVWRWGVAGGSNDERRRYARLHAAARGDREARDAIVAEARPGLIRRLQREMEGLHLDATEVVIAPVVEQACRVAFDNIAQKPADWSMYGWLVWHVEREAFDVAGELLSPREKSRGENRGSDRGAAQFNEEPDGEPSS